VVVGIAGVGTVGVGIVVCTGVDNCDDRSSSVVAWWSLCHIGARTKVVV